MSFGGSTLSSAENTQAGQDIDNYSCHFPAVQMENVVENLKCLSPGEVPAQTQALFDDVKYLC